jgi:hypothetical protein
VARCILVPAPIASGCATCAAAPKRTSCSCMTVKSAAEWCWRTARRPHMSSSKPSRRRASPSRASAGGVPSWMPPASSRSHLPPARYVVGLHVTRPFQGPSLPRVFIAEPDRPLWERPFAVGAGERIVVPELVLPPTLNLTTVEGVVAGTDGRLSPDATVYLHLPDFRGCASAILFASMQRERFALVCSAAIGIRSRPAVSCRAERRWFAGRVRTKVSTFRSRARLQS